MKYENTKHKLRTAFTKAQTNTDSITKFETQNTTTKNALKALNIPVFNFNHIHDFSSEWMDNEIDNVPVIKEITWDNETSWTGTFVFDSTYIAHKTLRLEIDNVPEKFLPFIDYKLVIESKSDTEWTDNYYTSSMLQKLSENDGIYNVVLIVGISTGIMQDEASFRVKLLLKIRNPQIFR